MKQYCLACDLKPDEKGILAYDDYHRKVWPEIKDSIRLAGIRDMEIYRTGNRLFMIMVTEDDFSFSKKAEMDLANPIVQKWENLMSVYQQKIPWSGPTEKWVLMEKVFKLDEGI